MISLRLAHLHTTRHEQVIDPYTGVALAEAPRLPDPVADMVWEVRWKSGLGLGWKERAWLKREGGEAEPVLAHCTPFCFNLAWYSCDASLQFTPSPKSQFPRMGPQVMLRGPAPSPGKPLRFEFMAFGGSFMDAELREDIRKCGPVTCDREKGEQRPCSDYSVRIGLTVKLDGR
jgi:hypothetical protein